jgi:hypothetical protein
VSGGGVRERRWCVPPLGIERWGGVRASTEHLTTAAPPRRAVVGPPWQRFADAVLQREALRCRVGEGREPRDVAGLYVDHGDIDRILSQLPGLDGPPESAMRSIDLVLGPLIERARTDLHEGPRVGEQDACPTPSHPLLDDAFARAVHGAGLGPEAVEVLALLASVELDRRRQQLLVYIQDSIELPRITLAALPRLFGPGAGWLQAVAPSGRLVVSRFAEVEDRGPWASRTIGLAPRLTWALVGADDPDPGLPADTRVIDVTGAGAMGTSQAPRLLLVAGGDPVTRRQTAATAAGGGRFLVAAEPVDEPGWAALVR